MPSHSEYTKLVTTYPYCIGKTTIITHGVDINGTGMTHAPRHRLLYAGRLVHNKGLEELIDAMAVLKVNDPRVQLFIIGAGRASYVRELKLRTISRGVSRIVHWLGWYDHGQLQAAYRHFGAVVMPSRAESFGLVALEALANGVPLVATQTGGLRQFVTTEVAQVIPHVDGASIAAAVIKMWQSPGIIRERVAAGRELARKYQWLHVAERYADAIVAARREYDAAERG